MRTFLAAHPNVQLYFTPTCSSGRNQVELWFAKIERDVLARAVFTSVADLKKKIMRYVSTLQRRREADPVVVRRDPSRRIA